MCGIVAGLSYRNIVPTLLLGLKRLEYRGYDSCGLAIYRSSENGNGEIERTRSTFRVADLVEQVNTAGHHGRALSATLAIAHTRWATHGAPHIDNAHPHFSYGPGKVAEGRPVRMTLVHNGIFENYEFIRQKLQAEGYVFAGQTDTEVAVHLVDSLYQGNLLEAVQRAVAQLVGTFSIAVFCTHEPNRLVGARNGCPLVLGISEQKKDIELFIASDAMALADKAEYIIGLHEGDCVDVQLGKYRLYDQSGHLLTEKERPIKVNKSRSVEAELGAYSHYMQKEIFEQPQALANTLEGVEAFTPELFQVIKGKLTAQEVLAGVDQCLILACGSSYYTGCVAKYWLESLAHIPCSVEIASEYRYRVSVPHAKTLVIVVSQSGETADTLAALKHAKSLGMNKTLAICNVATSAMVQECELAYLTRAGVEVGVASTKAFTAQLAGLFLLTMTLSKLRLQLTSEKEAQYLNLMRHLPSAVQSVLALETQLIAWSEHFAKKEHALFLGRGMHYPIAQEGALKLKEISYIHAESYAAGELKHGPLALVTEAMPIVAVAPNDALLEKIKSNLQEVRARGGELYVLADADSHIEAEKGVHLIRMPEHYGVLSPILYVVALQLLSYHTACVRGTDVDKPRNLAKSVTVE